MSRRILCMAAGVFCAVGWAVPALAQELVVNRFDSAAEVAAGKWRHDFGGAAETVSFDAAKDAGGSASSGSMKVVVPFSTNLAGDNKSAITNDAFFPGRNVSGYSALEADFFILPGSAESFNPNSNIFGYQSFAIRNTDGYAFQGEGGRNFGPAGQWFHVSVPTSSFAQPIDAMRALTLQLYGGPGHNVNGTVTYWVDNITFVPEPGAVGLLAATGVLFLRRRRA
jgi:hypothetical protein